MDRFDCGDATLAALELSLEEWLEAGRPADVTVRLQAEDALEEHYGALAQLGRIVVEFPSFMDGRGFSHGRKLRQSGFGGDLLAAGDILRDQWEFLQRCGFSALCNSVGDDTDGGDIAFPGFTVRYQAN